ncbi:sensor histidine kinase [Streptomyces sp. NPDC088789]|uniref:sensor histidine kinase n=1 Tax=Streptomyces sp. NPDC088789 TaxID=3365899 RepID=UPI0038130E02
MGLRAKTALVITLTVVVVTVLLGLLVHHRVSDNQKATAGQAAETELLAQIDSHAAGSQTSLLINPPDMPAPLRDLLTRRPVRATYLQQEPSSGPPRMWAATRSGGDFVAVRKPYAPQLRALRDLDRVLIGSGALTGALGCLIGIGAAAMLGRRITASTRTARRIADGDLTARIETHGRDEISLLSEAVNTMAHALAARLEAERRVTADIAHELRTPVAGLVAAVELLPPGRPAELIRGGVDRLRRTLEDVLEVARLDVPGVEQAAHEEILLSTVVRRVAATSLWGVDVRVQHDAWVRTDPRRVERIVTNLIVNAHRHGAPPVLLEVDGTALHVSDRGPGFPERLLSHGPTRFQSGFTGRHGPGLGLGLTIVAGQARVLGAQVRYENPARGGARATVDLGAQASPEEVKPG